MSIVGERLSIGELERRGAIIAIQDGNHGELHPKSNDYVDGGIPFVMANNFVGNSVDIASTQKLPHALAEKLRIGFSQDGDVLLTHKGTIGNTAIVKGADPFWMLTPQVTYYRVNPEQLDNRYLMYAFQEPFFQKTMRSRADQATRPYIGILAQRELQIIYRPLSEQKRVVNILTPYDELFAHNRRQIDLLERSARLLFKEWFVHLRYPGHEHDRIVDGLPEGWQRKKVGDVASFVSRGITPKYDDEAKGLVINQKCIRNRMLDLSLARHQSKEPPEAKLVKFGDILVNSTGEGTLGRVAQVLEGVENCTVDSHVTIVRPKPEIGTTFVGMWLTGLEDYLAKQGRGATNQTELSKGTIEELKLVAPAPTLVKEFESIVTPVYDQIRILARQSALLAEARDLLLPRLMDGRISV